MAFTYDSMGRPYSAVDPNNNGQGVGGAGHNAAGQLLSMPAAACCYSQQYLGQSCTYNSMGQLTWTSGADGATNIQYNYHPLQ